MWCSKRSIAFFQSLNPSVTNLVSPSLLAKSLVVTISASRTKSSEMCYAQNYLWVPLIPLRTKLPSMTLHFPCFPKNILSVTWNTLRLSWQQGASHGCDAVIISDVDTKGCLFSRGISALTNPLR